jgi:transcriptional regulator with XRE-family HTH domain
MVIGERLKELRKQEPISQGDVEKRTGLLRCYISRVENGHTVPSVDTLWKDDPRFGSSYVPDFYGRSTDKDQRLLLHMASKMANRA